MPVPRDFYESISEGILSGLVLSMADNVAPGGGINRE
jgi:hypothetical protein